MKWVRVAIFAAAAAMLTCTGCDDEPAGGIPQAVLDQQARKTAEVALPKAPTTQELVSAPPTTLALGPLPLTMRVPRSWAIKTTGGASLLSGFAPGGEVTIQLTSRPSLKQEELDRLINAAKKEQTQKPQSILKVEVRPLGNVQVYERQAVGEPAPYTVYDSNNQPHTTTESLFKWTLSVLAPHAGAHQVYELNFVGLTKSQYDADKAFLQGILDTLAYGAPAATSGPATTMQALPSSPALPTLP
jgi:hypothetical protein